ncbi:MAG: chloride channel protein [Gammaproteobacteria bacterium]|nr:chloride channel protein [Gammaproteobacteria bacterium]
MPAPANKPTARLSYLDRMRVRLAGRTALLQLSILGVTTGVIVGILMLLFRGAVEYVQFQLLPGGDPENYEALPADLRWLLPTLGGAVLALLFLVVKPKRRQGGIVHVLERLAYHQGHLSSRNAILEFLGAGISIITGQSVGREGPSVHLGAAGASILGRRLALPNNALRVLVGCGAAGAIGAAFNTPLAGVIFAMEVVLMEYTIAGFAPVMLAAVSATAITQLVYGAHPAFTVPEIAPLPLGELPVLLAVGVLIGALSASFNGGSVWLARKLRPLPLIARFPLAGLVTGLIALGVPAVMGIGYDTVNAAMLGELGLVALALIVAGKIIATAMTVGCNLPGGLIGPTLVIGAAAGSLAGLVVALLFPEHSWQPAIYTLVGMAAMMAATLQAPLAALVALLELSGDTLLIFPGMLTVVVAVLVSREFFKQESLLLQLMHARGLNYRNDPIAQSLRRIGVAGVMETDLQTVPAELDYPGARELLDSGPKWLLIDSEEERRYLLPAADLARYMAEHTGESEFNLVKLPGRRVELMPIHLQATLQEAYDVLQAQEADGVYILRPGMRSRVLGILTREGIENAYARW